MGIAEDLHKLEELHSKGKLSDEEFSKAKSSILQGESPVTVSRAVGRSVGFRVIPLAILALLLLGFYWYQRGNRETSQALATIVHAPVTIKDEVENLPASSWKAVAVELPYSGTLDISLEVVQGNPVDIYLTTPDQVQMLKQNANYQMRIYQNFTALKTKTYHRMENFHQGNYFLVLRDSSLGILSKSASDISLKARLSP